MSTAVERQVPLVTHLVVDVELAEIPTLCGAPVAVCESAETLETLRDGRSEAPLARQLRDQEDVLGGAYLVRAVSTTW